MIRIGRAAIALTGSIFAAAIPMLMPNTVQAECLEWDLSQVPEWHLKQSNGFIVSFTFRQRGTELQGSGSNYVPPYPNQLTKGTLKGSIYGRSFQVRPSWGGVYYGSVNGDGTLTGNAVNDAQTETATWNAQFEKATCLKEKTASPPSSGASAPPPPPPAPASPLDQAGVLKKPGKGGEILEQTVPPASPAGPIPAGAEYATAISPATIYVEPGGAAFKDANGDDIGMPLGSKALVLEKRTNPVWYKLQTKPVGWVWGEDVTLGP